MANSEQSKWREFLKPLVTAAAVALTAMAGYYQSGKNDSTDSRLTALEVRADVQDKRSDRFGTDIDNFKILLGDIRSDVSFIRGKLESGGKK